MTFTLITLLIFIQEGDNFPQFKAIVFKLLNTLFAGITVDKAIEKLVVVIPLSIN
jgi:hypothetical protein